MNREFFEVKEKQPERSFVKVYKDFLRSNLLTAEEKILYICLKSYAGYGKDEDNVYPSIKTLCQMSQLGRTSVKKYLTSLVKKGVIQREQRGLTQTNLYTLNDTAYIWGAKTEEELLERVQEESERSREELIEENKRLREEIKRLKEKGLSTDTDQSTDESPKRIYEYSAKRQDSNNLVNRQEKDKETKKRAKNQFNDFEQRQRSESEFNLLERRLIGQQFSEEENEK